MISAFINFSTVYTKNLRRGLRMFREIRRRDCRSYHGLLRNVLLDGVVLIR